MFISYTPTRAIAGGAGEIEADLSDDTPVTKMQGTQRRSHSGSSVETVLHRIEETVNIEAGPVNDTEAAKWREFEHSVAAGETFSIDLYGTLAAPDNAQSVRMQLGSFRRRRLGPAYWYYTFTILL